MAEKSPDAFRTISEVAEEVRVPAHVLRFWESRFVQIRPVKRAGGRRYYRRDDVDLIGGIKRLLHDHGMTIRGVQKLLKDHGTAHVAQMGGGSEAANGVPGRPAIEGFAPFAAPPALMVTPHPSPTEDGPDSSLDLDEAETEPPTEAEIDTDVVVKPVNGAPLSLPPASPLTLLSPPALLPPRPAPPLAAPAEPMAVLLRRVDAAHLAARASAIAPLAARLQALHARLAALSQSHV